MTDTPQSAWMREYKRLLNVRDIAMLRTPYRGEEFSAAHAALDAHVRGLVEERDALRGLLDACLNELGDTSAERVGPRIETLAHHPPLTEPQRLRMEAERIERRDALIVRVRAALAAPKDQPMKRYVKYRQACSCDAEPMPSAGISVLLHPLVCSGCKTPYREGPVMREVD